MEKPLEERLFWWRFKLIEVKAVNPGINLPGTVQDCPLVDLGIIIIFPDGPLNKTL